MSTSEDQRAGLDPAVVELADRYWDHLLELEPVLGTEVGDERYDDRLPDPSPAGLERRETIQRDVLRRVEAFDRAGLGMIERTTLDLMAAIARRDLDAIAYRFDRLHAASHLAGPASLLGDIASLQRADTPGRLDRYLGRLRAFPAYLDAVSDLVDEGARSGYTVPVVVVDRAIGQVERLLSLDPGDSPAMAPLAEAPSEARERGFGIVAERVWPAYGRYLERLRSYRPHAKEQIGVSALERGDDVYAAMVRAWTTLSLPADEVHRIGVESFAAIQEERREAARRLRHEDPEAALAEHTRSGTNTARSREEMVRLAEDQVRRGWEAAPAAFGRLPRASCSVRAIEEYREADMPFAFYFGPSQDGSRPGTYFVNTSDLDKRPLHHLATTTFHEANPGHHLQISLEYELPERPAVRRFGGILASSAFVEGWGLYAERLADEMELFENEYERLGMLDAQAMRAARLIVDTGIHALGWTRDRCIAQLEEAGVPHLDAVIETDRYIAMPGQALCYRLGQLEIERWREEAARRNGSSFSLRDFHDRLLSLGSLPLSVIDRELREGVEGASGGGLDRTE